MLKPTLLIWLKYIALFLFAVVITLSLVPVIFLIELQLFSYLPTNLETSIQISPADALTIASIFGAVSVFVLERYQSAVKDEKDIRASRALRLILKHINEQDEPKTIEEHWCIFKDDITGRKLYCDGDFGNISLDDFTAEIYHLRLEGQIELTHGGQVIPRLPLEIRVKRATEEEKSKIISVLQDLIEKGPDEYIRRDAAECFAKIKDSSVVPVITIL